MNRLRKMITPIVLIIITVWAWSSLVNGSYFSHHDSQHIARLYTLYQGLSQGVWYPRFVDVLGFGYGYPLFNFYPPLLYYVAALFHIFGASYVWSIKLVGIVGFIVAAWGVYAFVKLISGNKAAAYVAAILYTYAPYHGVNLYVRGALAEFTAMAVLPYVFVGLEQLRKGRRWGFVVFALSYAALILAHPLIAFPATFFIAVYIIWAIATTRSMWFVVQTGLAGLLGLGLSAFFWLPSMVERKFTLVDTILTRELASYTIHFVYPQQLWSSAWGYGGSGPGLSDGMSFQLGKVHVLLLIASLFALVYFVLRRWRIATQESSTPSVAAYALVFLMAVGSIAMTTLYSKPVWDAVQFLWYLQFPWRFLTFASLFVAVSGSFFVLASEEFLARTIKPTYVKRIVLGAVVLVYVVLSVYSQAKFRPEKYLTGDDAHWTAYKEIAWRVSETSHEFAPYGVALKTSIYGTTVMDVSESTINKRLYDVVPSALVKVTRDEYEKKEFITTSVDPISFTLRRFAFPGWTATIDGEPASISDSNRFKLVTIQLPSGHHTVKFAFRNTLIRTVGDVVSELSVLALLGSLYFVFWKKRSR